VTDLEHALTTGLDGKQDPGLVARSRAALSKRYGDIFLFGANSANRQKEKTR
jgi:hypothetical protein